MNEDWYKEMDRQCDEEILKRPFVLSCEEFKKVYGYDSEYCLDAMERND